MELNLEKLMDVRGAGVGRREEHVQWDLKVRQHITVCDLDVLDLGSVCLTFESLNAHQLCLNGLDLDLGLLQDQVSVERLVEAAVDRGDLSAEVESWDLALIFGIGHQSIRCDVEVLALKAPAELRQNSATWHSAVELLHDF